MAFLAVLLAISLPVALGASGLLPVASAPALWVALGVGMLGGGTLAALYTLIGGIGFLLRVHEVGLREALSGPFPGEDESAPEASHAERVTKDITPSLKFSATVGAFSAVTLGAIVFVIEALTRGLSAKALAVGGAASGLGFLAMFLLLSIPMLAADASSVVRATARDRRIIRERRERLDASEVRGALHVVEHAGKDGALSEVVHDASDVVLDLDTEDASGAAQDEVQVPVRHEQEVT